MQPEISYGEARHNLAYAYVHGHPGKKLMVTDVCLPISELAGAIEHAREALDMLALTGGGCWTCW